MSRRSSSCGYVVRDRGDDVRDPRGAGVHRPAARSRSSTFVPRDPRSGDGRHARRARGDRRTDLELPWGDEGGIEERLRGREGELAAVIIEPVQGAGGVRAAEPGFLEFLRALRPARRAPDLRRDHLVPDRARWRPRVYGVRPDLTTLGKIIAGGYPLAAFGGRADVMAIFDARRGRARQPRRDVQRQPRRGRRRARDPARADAIGISAARGARRPADDAAGPGSTADGSTQGRQSSGRSSRSSVAMPAAAFARARQPSEPLPRFAPRGLLPRAARHGRDPDCRHV